MLPVRPGLVAAQRVEDLRHSRPAHRLDRNQARAGSQPFKELRLHFNSFISAPSEFLGALALRHDAEIHARNADILAGNLAVAEEFFARHDNLFGWTRPGAGVNAWPEWRGPGDTRTMGEALLADAKLLIAHSALFDGGDRNVRLGLGCRGLEGAMDRFDDFLGRAYG